MTASIGNNDRMEDRRFYIIRVRENPYSGIFYVVLTLIYFWPKVFIPGYLTIALNPSNANTTNN